VGKKKKTLKKYEVHQAFHFSKHTPGQGGREEKFLSVMQPSIHYYPKEQKNKISHPSWYLT
jgi:hypothetical protein